MMILTRSLLTISLILNVRQALTLPSDIDQLKDHFFANLIEETRGIAASPLTDDVERNINLKIEGFLDIISPPVARKQRDTNDLLLNEKTTDVFILKGFQSRGFVPVNFPQDICMFHINHKIFAAALSYGKGNNGTLGSPKRSSNTILIFIREEGKFRKIYERESKFTTKIDCEATTEAGFIAVVNKVSEADFNGSEELLRIGSFVLRITLDTNSGEPMIETFQRISLPNQNGVRLWLRGLNLYLVFSYDTFSTSPLNACTVFKLTETNFNPMDDLPCQNAHAIEFFTVHHHLMVLVGNYRENNGTTDAFSLILRYDLNLEKFVEHQKILTNAIAVGKYFFFDHQDQRQHFLFIGNSFEINEFGLINYDAPSMIYKYVNGFFIPMQTINVKQVQAMVPMIGKNHEFHLLIASEEHEVQIYFYDGWKFNESPIDFTGDSFGAGVVSMRAYDNLINGTTTIVIANRDSYDPTWNVYTPIYAMKNDSSRLKSSISKWCSDAFDRLENFNVDETDEVLTSALELADPSSERANFLGKVFISNSSIVTITAKQLKGTRVSFSNETAQRVNSLASRLSQLSSAVHHVNNKIKFTKATQRTRRQAPMLIKTLIVNGPIKVQTINGRPVDDLVYKTNRRNQRIKDVVAKEILVNKELFVNQKIDGVELVDDNVILNRPDQVLRPLKIDNLTVKSMTDVATVNTVPFAEFFTLLRRKVDKKIPNMIQELNVDSMTIGRFLNERNFTGIAINSLKTSGDQIFTAPMNIGTLKANKIVFHKVLRDQRISDVPLSILIDVNDTRRKIEINQDIRFEDGVFINRLFVNDRINNINVKNGQLQVMRTQGPDRQVVTGEKFFDHVNLLSPIVLQGKIESKTLQKMNPIITINENLVLRGDYRITGPVSIRRSISATDDITTASNKLGLKNLVENGLNLFTSNTSNNNFVFQKIVEVKRNLQAVSLNQKLVNSFVKADIPEQQIVRGSTTFKNGLMVHDGTVQADVINDVDINQLNKTVLKRFSSVTQFIDGNVEIVDLKTPELVSPSAKINGKSIDLVLNVHESQVITKMTLPQAKVRTLKVENLHQQAGGKIFGTDVNLLIDDTVMTDSSVDSSVVASKSFSDLNVQHLTFSEENEWKSIIKNYENSIVQDINVTGSMIFNNEMRVGNLVVSGTINDVTYDDMVNNWLQVEGDQTFTAPQTFTSLTIDNNLIMPSGIINGQNISKMIEESIWIDEPIYVKNIEIDGEMLVWGKVLTPTVNGINLDGKLILNNTNDHQTLKKIVLYRDMTVEFINFTHLNGIDCERLTKAFAGDNGTANLQIHGSAHFNYPPEIGYLNNQNLKELYENIWISDKDVELTGDDIQFLGGARSDANLFADTINLKDLDYINQNYFSLTSNQNVGTYLNINGTVFINKSLFTQKTIVQGSIKTDENDKGLKIEDFATSILLNDRQQTITGNWTVNQLIIDGDFNGTINGLNFYDDVLHTGNWKTAEVTGSKRIQSVQTYDIKTPFVNGVDILAWYQNAVLLNSSAEQNIEGNVELGPAVFYEDLVVFGPVNGITINPETVLTKSNEGQVITGDLTIKTMTPQGVKPSFIKDLYLRNGINGKNITDIYLNTLKTTDSKIESKHIVFEQKLIAGSVETNENIYGVNVAEFLKKSDASGQLVKFQQNLEYLTTVGESLKESFNDDAVELSHFEYHQSIHGINIQKTVPFSIRSGSSVDFVIAVHERNANTSLETIKFYRWNRDLHSFTDDGSMSALQYSVASYQITKVDKVVKNSVDHLYVEIFDKSSESFYQSLMLFDPPSKTFVAVLQTESQFSTQSFTLNDGASACYGSFFPSFANLNIICDGQPPTLLKTAPIRSVSSQNGLIILLTDDHQLQIWSENKIRQVLKLMNPQSFASTRFDGKFYIAVSLDKVEQSIHHGSVEIFESNDDIDFKLVQSVELENPFLVQFSVIPSGDLLLYILTRNAGKTLSIYKYAGASYFVETIGASTIVNTGTDLRTMNIDGKTEFIAIVSDDIFIIQAVLKEY